MIFYNTKCVENKVHLNVKEIKVVCITVPNFIKIDSLF